MAVASMSLKLAENDLQVFEKYMAEINEQVSERLQLFENTSIELTAKTAEEDTLSRTKISSCQKASCIRHPSLLPI